jgi:hypothetical protein
MRENSESEDFARIGLFLFTGGMGVLQHDSLIQSRDIYHSLLQEDGEPDKETVSDHLPVMLELNF